MNLDTLFVTQLHETVRVHCFEGASMDPAGAQIPRLDGPAGAQSKFTNVTHGYEYFLESSKENGGGQIIKNTNVMLDTKLVKISSRNSF